MTKLTVSRKGHTRKAYTAKRDGKKVRVSKARVRPSTFETADRGKPGRGSKIVPPLERGALGGQGFFTRTKDEQKEIVFKRAKRLGEKRVVGELRALQVFFRRTDAGKSKRALELSKMVAGSFKGKQQVTFPEGLTKKPQ